MKKIELKIPTQASITYPIMLQSNLLHAPDQWLPADWRSKRIVIISDDQVATLYGKMLAEILEEAKPLLLSFPAGEMAKNHETVQLLLEKMLEQHCDRNTLLLALGGGVVGDIAGFTAAIYLRGIAFIQIPTTLLAMVDSSVGGKTGINTRHGKNLIGAFWQPSKVAIDLNCLASLPEVHMINGLIEAIKMYLTSEADYFHYTQTHLAAILNKDYTVLEEIIFSAVKIKSSLVGQDEKENNRRMIANFGHTIGHALENVRNYSILHGYAVALGILVEARISHLLGLLSKEELMSIQAMFAKLQISGNMLNDYDLDAIIRATYLDKKVKENQVRYVLLNKIGEVYQQDNNFAFPVSEDIVKQALLATREV